MLWIGERVGERVSACSEHVELSFGVLLEVSDTLTATSKPSFVLHAMSVLH
jgi:hypothetical protein